VLAPYSNGASVTGEKILNRFSATGYVLVACRKESTISPFRARYVVL
jgi:hypothetical protein